MKIQICSDLHLEFYKSIDYKEFIESSDAEILILAGDICNVESKNYYIFLKQISPLYKTILVIFGNHEYYGSSINDAEERFKENLYKNQIENVLFLQRDRYIVDNLYILGATLWSYIPPEHENLITYVINDYNYIKNFTVKDSNEIHKIDREYLASRIDHIRSINPNAKILVITHHAPLVKGTSHIKYEGNDTNCAFSSDLSDIVSKVNYWICGHTHHSNRFKHGDCEIILNCRGYRSEKTGYQKNLILEI